MVIITHTKEIEKICNVPDIEKIIEANWNISDCILDAYYRQTHQPSTPEEIPSCYIGKLHRWNSPYQHIVYGAYVRTFNWEMLEYKMKRVNDKNGYYKYYKRDKVFDAFKNYAKGFQFGFDNFLRDKVITPSLLSNNDTLKAQKIMDFLSTSHTGLSEQHSTEVDVFENWFEDGKESGYHYCAWYFIFENHKLFEPYFQPKENGYRESTPAKTFPEYILHDKSVKFAELLKSEFNKEKGKSIRLIIEVLIKKNMLTIETRQRTTIFKAMQKYFNRDIGKKQGIFDKTVYNEINDRPDFESIELRINTLLSKIK